jgi:hypothetical protein
MESFRVALERLTQNFVSDVVAAVSAALAEASAERQKKETRPKPNRIVRPAASTAAPTPEPRAVVVRHFDIPVGPPRRRRRRSDGSAPTRKPAAPPPEQVVKFEVVPHPERKNRRMVMTRLSSP